MLDGLFAIALGVWWRHRTTYAGVFQGIASNLIGPGAMQGGAATALLGLAIHFFIATAWSAIFLLVAQRLAWLSRMLATTRGAIVTGLLFGPCVWLFMDYVVIQLTQGRHTPASVPIFWILLAGHAFVVGLPIALIARPLARVQSTRSAVAGSTLAAERAGR